MTDVVAPDVRSRMMSNIRGKDTRPEMMVRRFLHRRGLRFRLHDRSLPGAPDLVFPRHRTVLFIHGCFWHRHEGCKLASVPASNADFWKKKFAGNVKRDSEVIVRLIDQGWKVIVLWECGLRRVSGDDSLDWLPQTITSGINDFVEWPSL